MTYEDYCKIEGIEENPAEKKMYEAGQHDVANDIAFCFGIATGTLEEEKNCVIEKVMATKTTIVSKAALCNIITYILKQNAKLKKQVENRNCSNCRRSKTGCPNDGSCHNFSLWQPFKNPEL